MSNKLEVPRKRDLEGKSLQPPVPPRPASVTGAAKRAAAPPPILHEPGAVDAAVAGAMRWFMALSLMTRMRIIGAVFAGLVIAISMLAEGFDAPVAEPSSHATSEAKAPPIPEGAHPPIPKTTPQYWVTTDDYPTAALREKAQGVTALKAAVDTDGRLSACTITASSGNAELDAQSCYLVRSRGRFIPARDDQGRDVEGIWHGRFRWMLP